MSEAYPNRNETPLTRDSLLNTVSVRYFGVAEFYLSIFKVILILLCLAFTFISMLGGNPLNDRYGFRYWTNPVSPLENGIKSI